MEPAQRIGERTMKKPELNGQQGRRNAKRTLGGIVLVVVCSAAPIPFLTNPVASGSAKRVEIEVLATQSVVAGQLAHFPFLMNIGDRPVTFHISGLAYGVDAEMVPGGNDRYELLLHTATDALAGYFTIVIRARCGSSVTSKSVYLQVEDPENGTHSR
jgi:hypothetical protein